VRIRPPLLLAPVVLAGTLLMAAPATVRAADGMTETGTTTYLVVPDKSQIQVTVVISDYNGKPDTVSNGYDYYYYWTATDIAVETQAGAVSVTSNGGSVSQTVTSSDAYYRYIKLNYPPVYYGQTRVVTATYTIPAAPHAPGGFRAGKAYASLCAIGNGNDTGSVSVEVPDGFSLYVDAGSDLPKSSSTKSGMVYSSGTLASPYKFWTCIDAEDPANLTQQKLTAVDQTFEIESWPEDPTWGTQISADVSGDVQRLEDLTGLKMPGGLITIVEAGDQQLGDYGGMYDFETRTASIPETITKSTVAHELSHIWFNDLTLTDPFIYEGLAGYSEKAAGPGNYTPCAAPGAYPGSGSPNLMTWVKLDNTSTKQQEDTVTWQYAASCYLFTTLADDMGPANFQKVMQAAAADEMAYQGATPGETLAGKAPVSPSHMLDLIDEIGLLPAGATDLDLAGKLFEQYGIFDATTLASRSTARSAYHALAAAAGGWFLPPVIRQAMSLWRFDDAGAAMATANQIIEVRDSIQKQIPGFSLDGTTIEKQFEAAASSGDLDNLLTLGKKEADAASKVAQATSLQNGGHSILQSIGLLGTDTATPLQQARTDLQNVNPDAASGDAQKVIDRINASNDQGLLRVAAGAGLLIVLLLLFALTAFLIRRRRAVAGGPGAGPAGQFATPPWILDTNLNAVSGPEAQGQSADGAPAGYTLAPPAVSELPAPLAPAAFPPDFQPPAGGSELAPPAPATPPAPPTPPAADEAPPPSPDEASPAPPPEGWRQE
jgi:hypothetical protein